MRTIIDLLQHHEDRRWSTINLVASENVLSPAAQTALSSDLAHRYCIPPENERPPGLWDYPNQYLIRQILERTQSLARDVYHGAFSDVRPLSGNNAVGIVLKALLQKGKTIYSVPRQCGGHFSTQEICVREGFQRLDLPYDLQHGSIDFQQLREECRRQPPDLVLLDASMQLFPHPLREIRDAVGPDVTISYDASHTFGLIGGGRFQDPLKETADLIHGSTHKSLFGPQKGMIVCKSDNEVAHKISEIITPYFVSNMHCHHIAALGIALEEIVMYGAEYAGQVVRNARALARHLYDGGVDVAFPERGFTDCHQVLCSIGTKEKAMNWNDRLEKAGIHANLIRIPFRDNEFGVRLGVCEITRRGMREKEIEELSNLLMRTLMGEPIGLIAHEVAMLSKRFQGVQYALSSEHPLIAGTGSH